MGTTIDFVAHTEHDGRMTSDLDFEALVERYYAPLYRFALSLTHRETDACDLTQETFLVWATKGYQLQDVTRVKAWLFTTLHRAFLESQRRYKRFPHQELDEGHHELPVVGSGVVDHMDALTVVGLLGKVDRVYQAPVALYYLEDYSYNEIATILDVPLGTIKSRISRGMSQLQAILARQPKPLPLPRKEGV